jgi:hypothetical protein
MHVNLEMIRTGSRGAGTLFYCKFCLLCGWDDSEVKEEGGGGQGGAGWGVPYLARSTGTVVSITNAAAANVHDQPLPLRCWNRCCSCQMCYTAAAATLVHVPLLPYYGAGIIIPAPPYACRLPC